MRITEVEELTPPLATALSDLVRQLTEHVQPPTRFELDRMLAASGVSLFIATGGDDEPADGGAEILGMITLAVFQVPTGLRAWIEDLVVDGRIRGRGVGEALTRHAVQRAVDLGAEKVLLTSSPFREAANRLYLRLGFVRRETNFYELRVDPEESVGC